MTSVAAAATKPATDLSTGGSLAKTGAQGDEQGGFAQALTDADAQPDDVLEEADGQANERAPGDAMGGAGLNGLKGLASLQQLALGTAPGSAAGAAGTTDVGQQGAALPSPFATLQAAGSQVLQQAVDGQVQGPEEQPAQAATDNSALLTGEEPFVLAMDPSKLAGIIAGLKRGTAADAKAQGEALATSEDAAGDPQAETATAPPDTSAAAMSAEALLQLMAAPGPAVAAQATADAGIAAIAPNGSSRVTDELSDTSGLGATDDGSVDLLTSLGGTADVQEQKSFRFQKAGDAAAAISLSIAKADDGSAELQDSAGDIGTQDTVVVLDSRRYLGFGMGSNASALLSAASSNHDWAAAMHPASALSNAASASSTGNVVNTLKLQLNPEHLGTVTANMRLSGDELTIHLTVHNAAAYRELNDDSKPMLEALRAQGFNVDQITVSLSSGADTGSNASNGQQANGNAQTAQQQLQRDGEAGRQQPQGQSQARQADRNEMENRNDTAVEASVRGGGNAGSLYL